MAFALRAVTPKEEDLQSSIITYSKRFWWGDFLIHAPNEQLLLSSDKRKFGVLRKLRKLGLRPGTPDLLLMLPSANYHGLWLELKRPLVTSLPYSQNAFLERARQAGYKAEWSNNFDHSVSLLTDYVKECPYKFLAVICKYCEGRGLIEGKSCKACLGSGKDWRRDSE